MSILKFLVLKMLLVYPDLMNFKRLVYNFPKFIFIKHFGNFAEI